MFYRLDKGILLTLLFLIGLGLVQVYSSSFIFATESYSSGRHFFIRQSLFAVVGIAVLFLVASLPWKWAYRLGLVCWALAIVGIIATHVPGIGVKAGGAHRWIQLPFDLRFEPAELYKVSLPFALASLFVTAEQTKGLWSWTWRLFVFLAPFVLILKQPDFGTFVILSLVSLSVFFVFGLKWRYILASIAMAVPAFYFLVLQVPYRYARVKTFLDPWSDPTDRGFQIIQSLLSFHSGGLTGSGLGQGQGKLFFLPEAHTDFTMAVLGEELGFIGFVFVMILYAFLIFRGLQISAKVTERGQQVVALGITTFFALSVFINVGVVLGLLPTKGLTLPFLSYGGSSLVSTCLGFGWFMNVQRQLDQENVGRKRRRFLPL